MGKFKNKVQFKNKSKGNSKKKRPAEKQQKKIKVKTKKNIETKIRALVEKTGVSEEIAKIDIVNAINVKKNLKKIINSEETTDNKSLTPVPIIEKKVDGDVKSLKRKRNKDKTTKELKLDNSNDNTETKTPSEQLMEDVEKPNTINDQTSEEKKPKTTKVEIENDAQSNKYNDEDIECTIFVGNLPQNIKKHQLSNLFKSYGTVKSVRIRTAIGKKLFTHKTRQETESLIAFIKMDSPESVEKALELTGTLFHDRHIRITKAKIDPAVNEDSAKRTIFVGNLRYSATEDKLYDLFSSCGEIESVRTIKNEKGCTGVAFVCFQKSESVGLSIELRNTLLDDRPIHVERHVKNKQIISKDRKKSKELHGKKGSNMRKVKDGKKKDAFKGIKMGKKKDYIKKKKQAHSREKRLATKIAPRIA